MAGRKAITCSVTIAQPPEQVFAYVTDVSKHAEWSAKPFRVEDLSGPVTKGATFTSYGAIPGDKNHRNDVEVTEYEPPSRFALRSAETTSHGATRRTVSSPTGMPGPIEASGTTIDGSGSTATSGPVLVLIPWSTS